MEVFAIARARNYNRLALYGRSDLAEIAILSSMEGGVSVVAVIDADPTSTPLAGKSVLPDFDSLSVHFDAVIITDVRNASRSFDEATKRLGPDRVLAPKLLGLRGSQRRSVAR